MRIYAIPGLGTNQHIFDSLEMRTQEFIVLKWPPLKKEYSMEEYAKQFLPQINTNEPFILLGLSFGGMIAVELGKILKPKKIILISSAKIRADIPFWIRALRYFPIYRIIPDKLIRRLSYHARWILGFMVNYLPDLAAMIKDMPKDYFRCAIHYIVNWKNNDIPDNTILIHGNKDRLLWFRKEHTEHVIDKGSHAMVITQAKEVNRVLEKILKEVA